MTVVGHFFSIPSICCLSPGSAVSSADWSPRKLSGPRRVLGVVEAKATGRASHADMHRGDQGFRSTVRQARDNLSTVSCS